MFALINKDTLEIVQLKDTNFVYDSEEFTELEVPDGADMVFMKAINEDGVYSLVEDTAKVLAASKATRIAALNTTTWNTILTEACSVYEIDPAGKSATDISILAMAAHSTYQDMVSHPASYVGAIFADEAAVLAYATPKLTASSAYGLFRVGVLASEAAQKAAIEAE